MDQRSHPPGLALDRGYPCLTMSGREWVGPLDERLSGVHSVG